MRSRSRSRSHYFNFVLVDIGDIPSTKRAAVEGNYGKMAMVRRADVIIGDGPPKRDSYRLGILTGLKLEQDSFQVVPEGMRNGFAMRFDQLGELIVCAD